MNLTDSIELLTGVGPRSYQLLQQLGIASIQDLLFHLPFRYQDRTRIKAIAELNKGDHSLIEGEIKAVSITPGRRPSLLCQLADASGSIYLRFFHFTAAQKNQLKSSVKLRCFGEARPAFRHFGLEMMHPEYRQFHEANELPIDPYLTPIYPSMQGLTQPLFRRLIDQALKLLVHETTLELLPENLLQSLQLVDLISALKYVHRPPPEANTDLLLRGEHPMQKRLAFEELIAQQLVLQQSRLLTQRETAPVLRSDAELRNRFLKHLGFQLTSAQQRVITEIDQDLTRSNPMLRLLQGDVGSGKTVVAAMALLNAVSNGVQAVLAAPTELLAEQHWQNFQSWFNPLGIPVGYLSGKQSKSVRKKNLDNISNNEVQIIIGTHAVFQEEVQYSRLSLIVVDEQHRFGVNQRLALREKGNQHAISPSIDYECNTDTAHLSNGCLCRFRYFGD